MVEDSGPLRVEAACDYVRQAALGLHHAFECGMVHRDIKPQNLMLTQKGQVKVLDFGLAGFVSESKPVGSLTEFGQGLGTPDYVAPEQIRDAHAADIRADIYSLGCTLYYLLTGLPPFPEGSVSQKIAAHLERMPRSISDLRSGLWDNLAQMIERMMAKEPAHRYQTPAEVANALASLASHNATPAPKVGRKTWLLAGVIAVAASIGLAMLTAPKPRGHSDENPRIGSEAENQKNGSQAPDAPEPSTNSKTPATESATLGTTKVSETRTSNKVIETKRLSSDDGKDFVK